MNAAPLLALSVLPESIMHTHWFAVLSHFVAINTIIYVSLSIFKIMPKLYLNDFVKSHRRRAETRSIYPNGHSAPEADELADPGLAATPRTAPSATAVVSTPTGATAVAATKPSGFVRKENGQDRRRIGDELSRRQTAIARYPRSYQRWSQSEESELRRHVEEGLRLEQIAELHQRSPAGTKTRINGLGLSLDPSTPEDTDHGDQTSEVDRDEPFFESHAAPRNRELTTTGG